MEFLLKFMGWTFSHSMFVYTQQIHECICQKKREKYSKVHRIFLSLLLSWPALDFEFEN